MSGILNTTGAVSGVLGTTVGTPVSSPTPVFAAYLSSSMTSLAQDVYHKVLFNTEHFDSDGAYDNSTNYRFTCPAGKAGYYLFHACVWWTAWGGTNSTYDSYQLQLRINNTTKAFSMVNFEPDIQRGNQQISHIHSLSVADYVDIYALSEQGSGTGTIFGSGAFSTRFHGTFLGE